MPLALLGLAFGKAIKAQLFRPVPVALAFIVGGLIILWAEKRKHTVRVREVEDLSWSDALKLGFAQALALLGLAFGKAIKAQLFQPVPVALAFIVGGLIIMWAEKREHTVRVREVEDLSWSDALELGIAQAFALIPGTSRSGATIIGGLLFGLSRKAATEFSFFLAIPTLFAASAYELYKERTLLHFDDLGMWAFPLLFDYCRHGCLALPVLLEKVLEVYSSQNIPVHHQERLFELVFY
jgi:undecaprenyl pyrophosphate phosphatase UppP